jgi:hypothetical protein
MNLNDMQTWQYVVIGGGALLVLSVILYFLPVKKLRVPGVLTAAIGGLAVGLAVGVIWLAGYGYKPNAPEAGPSAEAKEDAAPGPMMMGKAGGMPKAGGGAPKGAGFGGAPPSPRVQLVTLVNTLDRMVDQPVTLSLTADDRAAIASQLKGLDKAGSISDEDARARLDAILQVVEKDRTALEAIGYRWPNPDGKSRPKGGFGGPPPKDSPNPFHEGSNGDHLKSLKERLDKK